MDATARYSYSANRPPRRSPTTGRSRSGTRGRSLGPYAPRPATEPRGRVGAPSLTSGRIGRALVWHRATIRENRTRFEVETVHRMHGIDCIGALGADIVHATHENTAVLAARSLEWSWHA